jgi:hypothetical protein
MFFKPLVVCESLDLTKLGRPADAGYKKAQGLRYEALGFFLFARLGAANLRLFAAAQ